MKQADKRANEAYPNREMNGIVLDYKEQRRLFIEGYESAQKDGYTIEMEVVEGSMMPSAESIPILAHCDMILLPKDKFKVGDKIIVQIRKI